MKISPSLLAADFLNLGRDLQMLDMSTDLIHLDVMDGTLVPNISFGFSVLDPLSKAVTKPMDTHLMVVHPERWLEHLAKIGTALVSFHLEACDRDSLQADKIIDTIHALGMKAGVAVNPDMPVERLYPFIGNADFFLVMSVFAGFGGQKFIPETLERVAQLRREIDARGAVADIEVDGGVSMQNASALREAGATILVAGSSVFKAEDPAAMIASLREA